MPTTNKTITEFLEDDYLGFAVYTLEQRAIPSVIDGFKPTQRKVIHTASNIWRTGNEKPLKVFMLAGRVASETYYHHGDKSLNDAIVTMAQKFKNNLTLLAEEGQFGSLRSPTAGHPRYIGTKLTENFHLIYKDKELLEYKEEEGFEIEPYFFLPIIPMVLVNGSMGMSVGFKSEILNRNPIDIIDACILHLSGKKLKPIAPYIPGFNGTIEQDSTNHLKWIIRGNVEIINAATVRITELPPSYTFEEYEILLNELELPQAERTNKTLKKFKQKIESFDNSGKKGTILYTVKFTRAALAEMSKAGETYLHKYFQTEESKTENFICLNEAGKFIQFEKVEDVIKYFVDFRLTYYEKRKLKQIESTKEHIITLTEKARFIDLIIKGKIKIQNQPKVKVVEQLDNFKFKKISGDYEYLLRMPISSLTTEMYQKLLDHIKEAENELKLIQASVPKDVYAEELKELKKKIKLV